MRRVWVVLGACGDYYCEGGHLVAVCTTEESRDATLAAGHDQYEGLASYEVVVDEVIVDPDLP